MSVVLIRSDKLFLFVLLLTVGCFTSNKKQRYEADRENDASIQDFALDSSIEHSDVEFESHDARRSMSSCETDSDCTGGAVCVSGECIDRSPTAYVDSGSLDAGCETSQDCEGDRFCYRGQCSEGLVPDRDGGEEPAQEDKICTYHSDCRLVGKNCCYCSHSADEFWALEIEAAERFLEQCEDDIRCACVLLPQNPFIRAACRDGQCQSVDVIEPAEVSGCEEHSDCQLRAANCCECEENPTTTRLVAVSDPEKYQELMCNGIETCSACQPLYSEETKTFCDRGVCAVANP